MAAPSIPLHPETVELRTNVDWDTYVQFNDSLDTCGIRLTYHEGNLEIMTVSGDHDGVNRLIASLFENLAEGLEIDFKNFGGTTHRSRKAQTGFEPDTCFYVTNLDYRFKPGPIILPRDPAPDLIIEVDISRSSLNKMKAYAAVGCREGWRYHDGHLTLFALAPGQVEIVSASAVLPGVSVDDLNILLAKASEMPRIKWAPFVRNWARTRRA